MEKRIEKAIEELREIQNSISETIKKLEGKEEFKITKEVEERWKNIQPTKKTIGLLIKRGITQEEIPYIKTQWDAHQILNNLKKDNI